MSAPVHYWGQMQLNEGGDRYAAGVALAQRFSDAQLLFTGGSGALRDLTGAAVSEASVAERFFLNQGIDRDRLLLEGLSRNTAENARLSLALANPTPDETWVLVTSAFHMPRAIQSFELAGWGDLVPWPVDYRTSKFTDDIGWDLTRNLEVLNMVDPRASCTIVVQADGTMRYSSILNILQFDKGSLLTNPALSASIEIAHDRNCPLSRRL